MKQLLLVRTIQRELEEQGDSAIGKAAGQLHELGLMCELIGLDDLKADADYVFAEWKTGKLTLELALRECRKFEDRLQTSLARQQFLVIPASDVQLYKKRPLSNDVALKFPTAEVELIEASKCLSLDRHTACVFHCMRALEVGLYSLGKDVGLQEAALAEWGELTKRIDGRIRDMENAPRSEEKNERLKCYGGLAASFRTFNHAWRRHCAHVRENYGRNDAREIFDATVRFFRDSSSRLAE